MSEVPLYTRPRCLEKGPWTAYSSRQDNEHLPGPLQGPRRRPHRILQGYLAHKKTPTPLGPPKDPEHGPTVGS